MENKSQKVIDEFFKSELESKRRSILLALIQDMQFCVVQPGKWRPITLSNEQFSRVDEMRPSFTAVLIFCTGVDLLARVYKKQLPPPGKNGEYFKTAAKKLFGFKKPESDELWNIRNSISHNYTLNRANIKKHRTLYGFGAQVVINKDAKGNWSFYINSMLTSLEEAARRLHIQMSGESAIEKKKIANFLEKYGFLYIH